MAHSPRGEAGTGISIQDLDRAAVLATVELVCRVTPADLERPTPCDGWTLAGLLAHMSVQHRGFAAAARGNGEDLAVWRVGPPAADPVADYLAAASEVILAFGDGAGGGTGDDGAGDGTVLGREFRLPEISASAAFPATQAIGFHLVDYVVHGWDVARSIGLEPHLDGPVLEAALRIARQVPDGEPRTRPGAAFRPSRPAPPDAPPLDRIVAALGRSPAWPAGGPAPGPPVGPDLRPRFGHSWLRPCRRLPPRRGPCLPVGRSPPPGRSFTRSLIRNGQWSTPLPARVRPPSGACGPAFRRPCRCGWPSAPSGKLHGTVSFFGAPRSGSTSRPRPPFTLRVSLHQDSVRPIS